MRGRGAAAALLAAIALTGCGGQHGVWSIKTGMSQGEVHARLGAPDFVFQATFPDGRATCWSYRAQKEGTSITARNFCFRRGRVAHIGTGHHSELLDPL
jgi:hypothetical protein